MNTPYYLIHKEQLDQGMEKLKMAISQYWPNTIVGYSFKTNSLPWILAYMKEQGCHAEVVSGDEYELAERMGYKQIIYNGPVKEKESFVRACLSGQIVNLDAQRELEWLEEISSKFSGRLKVGVRVNFDLESMCPGEASGGEEGGRFGFSYETGVFSAALNRLKMIPTVQVAGIHLHCSSKTRSLNIYKAIAEMACQLKKEYSLELGYVDVGGGYFGGLENKPQYADYLREMSAILRKQFDPEETVLIVEPGTSLICPPIEYVTSVIDVKKTNRNYFVITDGSRIHVDPLMTKKSYFHHEKYQKLSAEGNLDKQVISGFTCMENDRLFVMENAPALKVGDQIIYEKVGAYTMCLAPLFIGYFPAVYLEENGKISCVREKWGPEEYMQKCIPEGK